MRTLRVLWALGHRQLLEVERGWRDVKQVIELRPVYHRLEGLALVLISGRPLPVSLVHRQALRRPDCRCKADPPRLHGL